LQSKDDQLLLLGHLLAVVVEVSGRFLDVCLDDEKEYLRVEELELLEEYWRCVVNLLLEQRREWGYKTGDGD